MDGNGSAASRLGARIAAVLAATALVFVLLEIAVRALGLAPEIAVIEVTTQQADFVSSENPRLLYKPKPNARDINSYGIRDREYPLQKPDGAYRVVVIGDSIGFGYCVMREVLSLEDTFANQLERELNVPGAAVPYEVINLSVSGYSTLQEVEFLREKGIPLQPDLVIVAYCLNDDRTEAYSAELVKFKKDERFEMSRGLARAIEKNALLHSATLRAFWYQAGRTTGDSRIRPRTTYTDRLQQGFAPLAELARHNGFGVLVVVFPDLHRQRNGRYTEESRHQAVLGVAQQYGMQTFDLLPAFLAASGGDLRLMRGRCSGMHPDEKGHLVAALAVAEQLRERDLGGTR